MNSEVTRQESVQLMITVNEHQRLQEIAREKQILDALMKTSTALLSGQSLMQVLEVILQGVQSAGFDRVRLYLLSEDKKFLVGKASVGMDVPFEGYTLVVAQDPYLRSLTADSGPRIFYREGIKPLPHDAGLGREKVPHWIHVPLGHNGEVIGLLVADNKFSKRPILPEVIGPFALFAAQAAITIANARLVQHKTDKLECLEKLAHFSNEMMGSLGRLSLDDRLTLIAKHATHILNAECSGVLLVKRPGVLSLEASYGHHPNGFQKGCELLIQSGPKLGLAGHVAYVGEMFNACGEALTGHFAIKGGQPFANSQQCHSLLAVPLKRLENGRQELVGLLRVDNKKDENGRSDPTVGFTKEDEWIISLFANAAVLAIQSASLLDEVQAQKNHFRRLVSSAPNGVITNDSRGYIQIFNEQAAAITGFSAEEMVDKRVGSIYVDPNEVYRIAHLLDDKGGKLEGYETTIVGKQGQHIPIRLTVTRLYNALGEQVGASGYFADLRVAREQEGRLDLIAKASNLLAEAEDLTNGLQQLAEMIATFWGTAFCRIFLLNEDEQLLTMRAVYPSPAAAVGFYWQPEVGSVTAVSEWDGLHELLYHREASLLRLTSKRAYPILHRWSQMLQLNCEIQSLLVVPLRTRNKVVGLLDLGDFSQEATPFFEERKKLAIAIAAQTAVLIDRMHLHETTERREKLLVALDETLRHIRAIKETPKLLQEMIRLAVSLTGCTAGGLCAYSPQIGELTLTAVFNLPENLVGSQISHFQGLVGEVARTGQPLYTNVYMNMPDAEALFMLLGFHSVIAVPLKTAVGVEAVLFVADFAPAHTVSTTDMEILERFAVQAAITLQTSLLLNKEQRQSSLWGILHRMSDSIQTTHDLDKVQHIFLTCVTAGYGLAYNRAALFLVDEQHGTINGRFAIGHTAAEEAWLGWETYHQQGLDNFNHYLTQLEENKIPSTPLGKIIQQIELPIETADIFTTVIKTGKYHLLSEYDIHHLPHTFFTQFKPAIPLLIVPLIVNKHPIGLLIVDNKFTAASITPEDIEQLLTFTNTAAAAIEKTQLLAETQTSRLHLQALYKASNDLVTSQDPDQVWRDIVQQIQTVANASGARMLLMDATLEHAQDLIITGAEHTILHGRIRPDGLSVQVMKTGKFVIVEDAIRERERVNPTFFERGVQAAVGLPINLEGNLIGVMWIYYNHPRRFFIAEIEALQFYVNQAAIAYENSRRLKELNAMQQAAQALARANTLKEVFGQALFYACQLFQASSANIWLFDHEHQKFMMGDAYGFPPSIWQKFKEVIPRPDGSAAKVMAFGWLGVQDINSTLEELNPAILPDLRQAGIRSFQGVSLAESQKKLGVLYLNYPFARNFREQEQKTLQTFAGHVSVAIAKARSLENMRKVKDTAGIVARVTTLSRLDETLKAAAQGIYDALRCDLVTLHIYEADKDVWVYPPKMIGVNHPERVQPSNAGNESIVRSVIQRDQKLRVVDDVSQDVVFQKSRFTKDEGICSSVVVPLQMGQECVGVAIISYRSLHRFGEDELEYIRLFANQAAVAIHNAQLYEREQRQATTLLALDKVAHAVSAPAHLVNDVLVAIAEEAWKLTGRFGQQARFSSVALLDGRRLVFRATYPLVYLAELQARVGFIDLDGEKIGITGRVAKTGEALLVGDVYLHPDYWQYDSETRSEIVVPIKLNGRVIGVINVEHPVPQAFDRHDLQALAALADYAATAIQNANMYEREQRQKLTLAALNEAGKAITQSLDLNQILQQIIAQAWELMRRRKYPINYISIWLVKGETAEPLGTYPVDSLSEVQRMMGKVLNWRVGKNGRIGIVGRTIATGKSVLEPDVTQSSYYLPIYPNTCSELAVPIKLRDEVIGVINLEHQELNAFDETDVEMLEALAVQAALAIQNARLYEKAVRHGRLLNVAARVASRAIGILAEDKLLKEVVNLITRYSDFYHTAVFLLNEDKTYAVLRAASSKGGQRMLKQGHQLRVEQEGIVGFVARTGHYYFAPDVTQDPYHKHNPLLPRTHSEIAFSLNARSKVIGVLDVQSSEPFDFSQEDIDALQTMANQLANAIHNAQLYNQLQKQLKASQALYTASQAITSSLDIQQTLNAIVQQATFLTATSGPEANLSYLATVHDGRLTFQAASVPEGLPFLQKKIGDIDLTQAKPMSVAGRAVKTGQPQLVQDVCCDDDYIAYDPNVRSMLAVPIQNSDQVRGVIVVESFTLNAFDDQDQQALVALANQACLAIQNAEEYQETQILQMLSAALAEALELSEVLPLAMAAAMALTDTDSSAVIFWDQEQRIYESAFRMTASEEQLEPYRTTARPEGGMTQEILLNKRSIVVHDTSRHPGINPDTLARGRKSQIGVPLWNETAVFGVLYVHSLKPRRFSPHQVTVLETLAGQTAVAIHRAKQYQELKEAKGLVGARTALAWMGMASNAWRHSIEGDAVNIRNLVPMLRGEVSSIVSNPYMHNKIEERLNRIERLASHILHHPITPPLSSEDGIEEVAINDLLTERINQLWKGEYQEDFPFPLLNLSATTNKIVLLSPEWLRLALDLLIDNAMKAMRASPIRQLDIFTVAHPTKIEIAIRDTGKGIPPEMVDKLFKVTFPEPKREGHLGRGLLMVQAIVHTFRGDIDVRETGPQGTTLVITLPTKPLP